MHEIIIEKLVLKKDCDVFIEHFYDVSIDFFLLLLLHQENEATFKIAFFKAGATFWDYAINLSVDNTRVLSSKSFEFEALQGALEFSLILLENRNRQSLNLTKIKKLVHKYALINHKNTGIIFHPLSKVKVPMKVLQPKQAIRFDNSFISIEFSLK